MEASDDGQARKRASRLAHGARKRADDAHKLASEKAAAAGLPSLVRAGDPEHTAMPHCQPPTDAAGNPKAQDQRNFTDSDSHILKGPDGWMQGYNAQAAFDDGHEVIVTDTGQLPVVLTADACYCSTASLEACQERGLDAYISTSSQQHGKRLRSSRGRTARDLDARGRMDRKLRSKGGNVTYALHKTLVEPGFGQISGSRQQERFRLRGLEQVNGEWALMAATPNILKLFRASLVSA